MFPRWQFHQTEATNVDQCHVEFSFMLIHEETELFLRLSFIHFMKHVNNEFFIGLSY